MNTSKSKCQDSPLNKKKGSKWVSLCVHVSTLKENLLKLISMIKIVII